MYISPSPPRRSGTRGSFRQGFRGITQDVREGLHDVGQTIKRRMSSGVGDGGRGKKPKINRTLSKIANKAANKANEMFGKYTPRPSESDSAARDMNYHEYQHSSNISPESRQESQVMVTDESYLYQSTMQQMHQQPHENAWSMDMTTDCEPSPSKAMASSSTTPSYGWVQGIGTSSYPLEDWQQQRTAASISLEASPINPRNRDALLGRLSVTPPPDPRFVHGPWQDLHQLSGSRLSGTHKDRFNNTVRKANELTAVVTGDLNSHGQPLSNNVSPTTKDAAAFPLSSATTPSPGPTGKGKHKEESIHYRDDELDATSSENDEDDDGDGDGDNTEKPCPWPNCAGTTKSKAFQPNRLKEHIRRGHLMPFMCDSPGCGVRKGDKNQIYRHRAAKHPDEPKKRCKEQDQDPIAQKKYRALNERSLSYDRITDICRATTIAELEEPWERAARASSSNLVKTESPLSPTGAFEPGLGLSSNIFNQTSGPSSANSTPFPDIITSGFGTNAAPSPATHYPGFMNSCQDGSLPLDDAIMNFVKDVLVPAVDKMSLQASPQLSRQSRDEHLGRIVSRLMSAAQEGLDRLERRRSAVSEQQQSYTDMLGVGSSSHTPNPDVTPALTNAGTRTLTERSASYNSLKLGQYAPPLGPIAGSPKTSTDVTERFEWDAQHTQAQIYDSNLSAVEVGGKNPADVFHGGGQDYDGDVQTGTGPNRQRSFPFDDWVHHTNFNSGTL